MRYMENAIKFLLLLTSIILCMKEDVIAKASSNEIREAKEAYRDFLQVLNEDWSDSGYTDYYFKFGLLDVNNDKLPELIYAIGDSAHVKICTYINNNVEEVYSIGLGTTMKIYPKRKIIYQKGIHAGMYYEYYHKFNGKKTILLTSKEGSDCENLVTGKHKKHPKIDVYSPFLYKVKGKRVSKSKYTKYVRKIKKGAKQKKIKLYNYNNSNLNKYLK